MQTLKNRIEKLPTLKNQPAKRQLQTATNQLRPLTDIERRPQKINFFGPPTSGHFCFCLLEKMFV